MHDWLILMLLLVIEVVLFIIHPFYRFVGKDMMTDLRYPIKDSTVPVWAVPVSYYYLSCLLINFLYDLVWSDDSIVLPLVNYDCMLKNEFLSQR